MGPFADSSNECFGLQQGSICDFCDRRISRSPRLTRLAVVNKSLSVQSGNSSAFVRCHHESEHIQCHRMRTEDMRGSERFDSCFGAVISMILLKVLPNIMKVDQFASHAFRILKGAIIRNPMHKIHHLCYSKISCRQEKLLLPAWRWWSTAAIISTRCGATFSSGLKGSIVFTYC